MHQDGDYWLLHPRDKGGSTLKMVTIALRCNPVSVLIQIFLFPCFLFIYFFIIITFNFLIFFFNCGLGPFSYSRSLRPIFLTHNTSAMELESIYVLRVFS